MGLKELWSRLTGAEHTHAEHAREARDAPSYDDVKMHERVDETLPGGSHAAEDLAE